MREFRTEVSREEFLLNAEPLEVLNYLDQFAIEQREKGNSYSRRLPEHIAEKLFERNERLIDLGLSVICETKITEKIRQRRTGDNQILANLLSNEIAVEGLHSPPAWIEEIFEPLIMHGELEVIKCYVQNKNISPKIAEHILGRESVFGLIDNKRYYTTLAYFFENQIIKVKPQDRHDYDMSQHAIIQGCWQLLYYLPVNTVTASLLSNYIKNFQEFEIGYRFCESLGVTRDQKNSTKWDEIGARLYLKTVLPRWIYIPPDDKDNEDWFNSIHHYHYDEIRRSVIEKMTRYELKRQEQTVLSLGDPVVIAAYFSNIYQHFTDLDSHINEHYKKYGRAFLVGMVGTDALYRKNQLHIGSKIYKLIDAFEEANDVEDYDKLETLFNWKLHDLKKSDNAHLYIESTYEYISYEEDEDVANASKEDIDSYENLGKRIEHIGGKISDLSRKATVDLNGQLEISRNFSEQLVLVSKKIDDLKKIIEIIINNQHRLLADTTKRINDLNVFFYTIIGLLILLIIFK